MQHGHLFIELLTTALTGAGGQRILTDIARSMPPLPPGAGYFARWAWGAIQTVTGHDVAANPPSK